MNASKELTAQTIELSPSYRIPVILVIAAIILLLQPWGGWGTRVVCSLGTAFFGLFLMFQAVTIRLQFTSTALDIYRSEKLIRRFPYADWTDARILWSSIPILFYFKEINSIHFLPIIFDSKMLKKCLNEYLV
ncbi:MAG: DUF3119 family protein [Prochloron sp. SP5CPC1]|nr:DUF3119 family protein [Candidatus Paraprochloron terpiosi SP5CPC1]